MRGIWHICGQRSGFATRHPNEDDGLVPDMANSNRTTLAPCAVRWTLAHRLLRKLNSEHVPRRIRRSLQSFSVSYSPKYGFPLLLRPKRRAMYEETDGGKPAFRSSGDMRFNAICRNFGLVSGLVRRARSLRCARTSSRNRGHLCAIAICACADTETHSAPRSCPSLHATVEEDNFMRRHCSSHDKHRREAAGDDRSGSSWLRGPLLRRVIFKGASLSSR